MSQVPRTCPACWERVGDADRFCRTCGKPLEAAEAVTPPPAVQPFAAPVPPSRSPAASSARPAGSGWRAPRRSDGAGAALQRVLGRLGRAALGGLGLLVVVGIFGVVIAGLADDGGTTERPDRTARPTGPVAVQTAAPTRAPDRTPLATPAPTRAPDRTPLVTAEPVPTRLQLGLRDAVAGEMVEMTVSGRNLEELRIELESLVDVPLDVMIEAGIVFRPGSGSVQPMVVIVDTSLRVDPGETTARTLLVACASMLLDEPDSSDSFRLAAKPAAADLRRLFDVAGFHDAEFRVQQFAVWTITDNPTRSGYVRLGYFGVGSGPSAAEIREIRTLFRAAGIDIEQYRALR